MSNLRDVLSRHTYLRFLLMLTGVMLLAGIVSFGFTVAGLHHGKHSERVVAAAGQRLVVTDPSETDSTTVSLVADLGKQGFTVTKAPADLSSLSATTTQSVVFTAKGFHDSAPNAVRSLYNHGITVAAINVAIPELSNVLQPNGPALPSLKGASPPPPPPSTAWLPVSSQYTVFSIMAPGAKFSDRLISSSSFVGILEAHQATRPQPALTPPPERG